MKCDVLIVGGGPAGLAAAIALRRRGVDVLLADALAPPIDKACGEGIMPDSRRDLARIGVEIPDSCGANFTGIRFCDGESSVAAAFPSGRGVGVRRTVLHGILVDHAADIGVRLLWNARAAINSSHPITINGEPVRYRYLVGADGQASRVRAWAGLEQGALHTSRTGFRIHYRIAPWTSNVEVHWAAAGQAYVTPVAPGQVCVSVMTRNPRDGGLPPVHSRVAHSHDIVASISELKDRLEGVDIITRERGSITTTRRLKHVAAGNVALVGDASGSADAITGEGLALGFRQALLLADSICPEYGAQGLSQYEQAHSKIMRLPQTMARFMLLMDRWPTLRRRVLRMLAKDPALFESMLHVHLGETEIHDFLLRQAPGIGLRLLTPSLV
jgi:menaquinone-9 beta-reductase